MGLCAGSVFLLLLHLNFHMRGKAVASASLLVYVSVMSLSTRFIRRSEEQYDSAD